MTEKKDLTVKGAVWEIIMVLVAVWLIIWMLRMSGINLL
jgi:hypothetical protein